MHRLSCLTSQPLACAVAGTLWSLALVGHATPVALVAQVSAEKVTINDNRRAAGTLVAGHADDPPRGAARRLASGWRWRSRRPGQGICGRRRAAADPGPAHPRPGRHRDPRRRPQRSRRRAAGHSWPVHAARQARTAAPMIAPGETREFTFPAGSPGTYYYWGATTPQRRWRNGRAATRSCPARSSSIRTARAATPDRVLLIGNWTTTSRSENPDAPPIRDQRTVVAAHRAAHVPRRRHRAHAADQCRRRRPPDASARLLFQRRQPRRRSVRTRCSRPELRRVWS